MVIKLDTRKIFTGSTTKLMVANLVSQMCP